MAAVSYPPAIPTLTLGNRVFTDFQNFTVLRGYCSGTTNVRCTLRKLSGSAGYQVPVGKKFKLKAARIWTEHTAASSSLPAVIAYADNDVGQNASTAFTNPVYQCGAIEPSGLGSQGFNSTCIQEFLFHDWEVPAGKYVVAQAMNTGVVAITVELFGEEVAA